MHLICTLLDIENFALILRYAIINLLIIHNIKSNLIQIILCMKINIWLLTANTCTQSMYRSDQAVWCGEV